MARARCVWGGSAARRAASGAKRAACDLGAIALDEVFRDGAAPAIYDAKTNALAASARNAQRCQRPSPWIRVRATPG